MIRPPGTCRGCGQPVELRLQSEAIEQTAHGYPAERDLPVGWCDPGTWDDHRCRA